MTGDHERLCKQQNTSQKLGMNFQTIIIYGNDLQDWFAPGWPVWTAPYPSGTQNQASPACCWYVETLKIQPLHQSAHN